MVTRKMLGQVILYELEGWVANKLYSGVASSGLNEKRIIGGWITSTTFVLPQFSGSVRVNKSGRKRLEMHQIQLFKRWVREVNE